MEHLIILLIKMLVKAFDKSGQGPKQGRPGRQGEQQAWEQQHREWLARRQQWEREQAEQLARSGPSSVRSSRPVPLPSAVRSRDPAPAGPGRKSGKQAGKRLAPPPLPATRSAPAQRFSAAASPLATRTSAGVAHRDARAAGVDAMALARWMRPETLRSQFVLTEILKPPLALRPPRA